MFALGVKVGWRRGFYELQLWLLVACEVVRRAQIPGNCVLH